MEAKLSAGRWGIIQINGKKSRKNKNNNNNLYIHFENILESVGCLVSTGSCSIFNHSTGPNYDALHLFSFSSSFILFLHFRFKVSRLILCWPTKSNMISYFQTIHILNVPNPFLFKKSFFDPNVYSTSNPTFKYCI